MQAAVVTIYTSLHLFGYNNRWTEQVQKRVQAIINKKTQHNYTLHYIIRMVNG